MTKRPALKEYQSRAVSFANKHKYSILALDPGLGKSRVAIEQRDRLQSNCLVVCPGYLVPNWVKEIKKWSTSKDTQITAFRTGAGIYEPFDSDYVIVSYDLVQKADHLFEWADMVILDEAHSIKSMKAKRTEFIHKNIYENSVPRVYLLTGTPIKNRVQEYYSLLALCYYNPNAADSQFLELYPSEIDFADHFSYRDQYTMEINGRRVTILKWKGLRNVKELRKWLEGIYFRVASTDVLDLPPVTYKSVLVSDIHSLS
jgi:SNF2 family DNA or RNA helicase